MLCTIYFRIFLRALIFIPYTDMKRCAGCYEVFSAPLESALKNFHGNSEHTGKVPGGLSEEITKKKRIEELKAEIQKAVAMENYEEAAKMHKELKSLL